MEQYTILELIDERNDFLRKEKSLCLASIESLNTEYRQLLTNDFGSQLANNCAKDVAGEVCRRFFDMGDYYITADQLADRLVHFSYDNDKDIFSTDETIRKAFYNYTDAITSETFAHIRATCDKAQVKMFEKDTVVKDNAKTTRKYRDIQLMTSKKAAYRNEQAAQNGEVIYDEISGARSDKRQLEVDHVQSAAAATYNSRYISEKGYQKLKDFYNSSDNFQMLEKSANGSKGDVRVYDKDGNDITHRATPEQMAEAVGKRWENVKNPETRKKFIEDGLLDENGKLTEKAKRELVQRYRKSMNTESKILLTNMQYGAVATDALQYTKQSMGKIIAGQVIYYVLPPTIFETQRILRKKNMTLDGFFRELKRAGHRIIAYVRSKLGEMFKNVAFNGINNFLKAFMDIVIEVVKATVKRLLKVLKNVVLSLVQCVKITIDKHSSKAEKADAMTKIMATTISTVIIELFLEYLEKQFGIPNFIMEPLQIIVTILATNIIMLVLQKADLFDVQYGLLSANIEKVFDSNLEAYQTQRKALSTLNEESIVYQLNHIKADIYDIQENLTRLSPHCIDVIENLDKINKVFDMKLDFELEWQNFIGIG